MSPSAFLRLVRPLRLDDESLDNLEALRRSVIAGGTLDPLVIYADGREDGRHRAELARRMGWTLVPVILFPRDKIAGDGSRSRVQASGFGLPQRVGALRGRRVHLVGGTRLLNLTGYDTADLGQLIERGRRAAGVRRHVTVVAEASPIRSRGCATVGGADMVLAVASPSRWSLRRLARLVDHEMLHLAGRQHGEMADGDLYSLGPVPAWARGLRVRYRGRAPRQVP